jgi:hypothetical protein
MTFPEPEPRYPAVPAYQHESDQRAGGQRNGFGVSAIVLGVASIPTACCFGAGGIFGIAGILTGAIGVRKASQGLASNRDLAVAGLICSVLGVLFSITFWALFTLPSASSDLFR